jgi:hypothetical protein
MYVGKFNGHLESFTAIQYMLWPFGKFSGHFVAYIFPFWYVLPRKIWQPCQSFESFFVFAKIRRIFLHSMRSAAA